MMNFLLLFMWLPYIISAPFHCNVALINVCCLSSVTHFYLLPHSLTFEELHLEMLQRLSLVPGSLPRMRAVGLRFWWQSALVRSAGSSEASRKAVFAAGAEAIFKNTHEQQSDSVQMIQRASVFNCLSITFQVHLCAQL